MRIIHCADVHLGSKMDSRLPREKAEERRRELRSSLTNLVRYAKENGVSVILLAGDVFDSDRPLKKDKEFFYSMVANNPDIDFLYLRGNHDGLQSYVQTPENLKTFSDKWQVYRYGRIAVYGIEMTAENCGSLYASLHAEEGDVNIVALHGQIAESAGKDKISISRLRSKNIDYLALGHVHKRMAGKIDERGKYAYSGCLEGRGFDEDGEKGFLLLDISDQIDSVGFVPFSKRVIRIADIDVTQSKDDYSAYRLVGAELKCRKSDIVRVRLTGEISYDNADLADEIEKRLQAEGYYYIEVKDGTVRKLNAEDYAGDLSVKGEFIRLVLADTELDENTKKSVISAGLKALEGRDID